MNYDSSYYSDDYNSYDIIIKIPHFIGTGIKVAKMIERKRFNFSFNLVQDQKKSEQKKSEQKKSEQKKSDQKKSEQEQKKPDQSKQCISSER